MPKVEPQDSVKTAVESAPPPGGIYQKELIDHLTKEILCLSDQSMTFRTKGSIFLPSKSLPA